MGCGAGRDPGQRGALVEKLSYTQGLVTRAPRRGCVCCDEPAVVMSRRFQGKLKGPEVHRDSTLCPQLLCNPEVIPKPILAYEQFLPRAFMCVRVGG